MWWHFATSGLTKDGWSFSERVNFDKLPWWTPHERWHFRLAKFSLMYISQLASRHLLEEFFYLGRWNDTRYAPSPLTILSAIKRKVVESLSWAYCGKMSFRGGTRWRHCLGGGREWSPVQSLASCINLPSQTQGPLSFTFGLSFFIHRLLNSQWANETYSAKETVTYPEKARMMSPFTELLKCLP